MPDTWSDAFKIEMRRASRLALIFSVAVSVVLLASRYLSDHVSNWFGLPLMLGYMVSIPAIIVTTVLVGSTFPSWSDHAPYLFLLVMTVFNFLFYTPVIAAFRSLNRIGKEK